MNDENLTTEIKWREKLRHQEIQAFKTNTSDDYLCSPGWKYDLHLGQDADICLQRILEIIQIMVNTPRHSWPQTKEWRNLLPLWFQLKTPSLSRAEVDKMLASTPRDQWHLLPWDFASWLDAIQVREWRWCRYEFSSPQMVIYLALDGWPAHLNTFEHLVRSAGAIITASTNLKTLK